MIVHTYALTAPVSPSAVWRHWVDVDQWTDHFPGLASARLNGPVAIGAVGLIKPDRGPRWSFRISAVDRVKKRFAIERKVLFGVVRLEFALERPEEAEDAAAFDPPLPFLDYTDAFGNRCTRIVAPMGRTTISTQEITEMIAHIQQGTKQAVTAMETSVAEVEQGVQLANAAGESIERIAEGSGRVIDYASHISDALKEQSVASNQVARNVETIVQMADKNHQTVNRATAAVKLIEDAMQTLRQAVGRFKIG